MIWWNTEHENYEMCSKLTSLRNRFFAFWNKSGLRAFFLNLNREMRYNIRIVYWGNLVIFMLKKKTKSNSYSLRKN
jgi:hypothetical protein